jgi:hypothetical protein
MLLQPTRQRDSHAASCPDKAVRASCRPPASPATCPRSITDSSRLLRHPRSSLGQPPPDNASARPLPPLKLPPALIQLVPPSPAVLITHWPPAVVSPCADRPRRSVSASSQPSALWPSPVFGSLPSTPFVTGRRSLSAGPAEGPHHVAAVGATSTDLHPPERHRVVPTPPSTTPFQ